MPKKHVCFLIIIFLISNSSSKDNPFTTKKLEDLTYTPFSLDNKFIIFEYDNKERLFNSSINFIFKKGNESSIKVYIYDSFDKINMTDDGFVDSLNETTLDSKYYIKISYDDDFYRDNCTFYLVLYDPSKTYNDSIYVVNSLKYLNLDNEITFGSNYAISFNFLIEKDYPTYFHYQTVIPTFSFSFVYINITSENGENLLTHNCERESGYVKIEPNVKYYTHIQICRDIFTDKVNGAFSLNYEKYKNHILIKDDSEINRTMIISQRYTFFKNISNLTIDESIIVNFVYSGHEKYYLYYKYYNSSDFETLFENNSFPNDRKNFDSLLGIGYDISTYEIRKENTSQNGFLIGFFMENEGSILGNSNFKIRVYKANNEDREEKSSDDMSVSSKKNSKLSVGWIIFIVMISLIIVAIIIWVIYAQIKKRNKKIESLMSNDISNNYYNANQKNLSEGNYNSVPENNGNDAHYNKILPNDDSGYDNYPACPAINEN